MSRIIHGATISLILATNSSNKFVATQYYTDEKIEIKN